MIRSLAILLVVALVAIGSAASAQSLPPEARAYFGSWRVNDPGDGAQAVVELYEVDGRLYGRVLRSLKAAAPASGPVPCPRCQGEFAGADLREVPIIRDLRWTGDRFGDGFIYDPRSGRRYSCTMKLEGPNRLSVRGFVAVRLFGRTQVWDRVR